MKKYTENIRQLDESPRLSRLITTKEAASLLGIGKRTLQEIMANNAITYIKINRCVRFDVADINEYVKENTIKAEGSQQ